MAKKHIKGCYNLECRRYRKEYKYKDTDNFCTICGSKLVYVCTECFNKISEEKTDAVLCDECQAKYDERKGKINSSIGKVKTVANAGVEIGAKAADIATWAKPGKNAAVKIGTAVVEKIIKK